MGEGTTACLSFDKATRGMYMNYLRQYNLFSTTLTNATRGARRREREAGRGNEAAGQLRAQCRRKPYRGGDGNVS
jgi:hypothetical protein